MLLLASSSYRISLMRGHGLFKNNKRTFSFLGLCSHFQRLRPNFVLWKYWAKKNFIRNHFQKGQELFVTNPVITSSRPEQTFWLFCSGVFILQGDRKGEWRWPLSSIQACVLECMELYLYYPIRLLNMVWN
jgi:hypothetical protein